MDGMLIALGLLVGLFVVLAPIFAWVAFFQVLDLKRKVGILEAQLRHVASVPRPDPWQAGSTAQPEPEQPPAAEAAPEAAAQAAPPETVQEEAPPPAPAEALEAAPDSDASPPQTPAAQPAALSRAAEVERALTSRWLVWVGALAVGLSAVFLFSYAIEQGWLGAVQRVVLGLILGAALLAGGEWTHRHPIPGLKRAVSPDYVPPALTASGLFALYASLYAAHGVFGLIGAAPAFAALGAVSFAGLVLAVRQGWFVALMGLAGGYAVPLLMESSQPAPVPVFLFVFVLTLGCLAVMVFRKWPFLAIATLLGSAGWPILWFAGPWTIADQGVIGLYALATATAFALLSTGLPVKRPEAPATRWLEGVIADTSGMGFVAQGAILVILAGISDFNEASFVFLGLYAALGMVLGLRRGAYQSLAAAGALVVAAAFILWPQPAELIVPEDLARHGIRDYGDTFGPIRMPPEFLVFARAALGFAALYGIGGLLALRRAATPAVWAALSAGMPLYLLTLAYWRIGNVGLSLDWGLMAAGLSAALLGAAALVARLVGRDRRDEPLSLYAASCTAAMALAFTCVLREAWLTVALSAEVLALAWIWTRLPVIYLRGIAYAVAGAVIVRLVLNPYVVSYGGEGPVSWVVYGYGLPAVAFLLAVHRFGDPKRDPLAALCQAGGLAFAFLTVALQLRDWTAGALVGPRYGLFDQGVQSVWWLIAAAVLVRHEVTERSPVALYGGQALLGLAVLQIGLGHLLAENPLLVYQQVGGVPVLNLLGLAYLAPALLFLAISRSGRTELPDWARQGLRGGAGVLIFVYLSLEVRRAFWGEVIAMGWDRVATDAEVYAYSVAWILYALALLAVGVLRDARVPRYASLAVLGIAVAKVFLYDMSDLTGLYRVASFLGLGLVLIGIGYVYQRFVFLPPAEEDARAGG